MYTYSGVAYSSKHCSCSYLLCIIEVKLRVIRVKAESYDPIYLRTEQLHRRYLSEATPHHQLVYSMDVFCNLREAAEVWLMSFKKRRRRLRVQINL